MSDEAPEAKQQVNMEVDQAGDQESTKDVKNRDDEAEDTKNAADLEEASETKAIDQPANLESKEPEEESTKTELEEPASSESKGVSEESKPEDDPEKASKEEIVAKDEKMDISETPQTEAEQKDSKVPEQEEKQPEDESEQNDDKTDAKSQDSVEVSKASEAETSEDNVKSDDTTIEQSSPIPDTQDSASEDTAIVVRCENENAKEDQISVKKDNEDSADDKVESSLEIKTESSSALKTEPKLKEYLPAKVVLENIDDKKMQSLLQDQGKPSQVSFATQIMDKDLSALDEELDDLKIRKSNNYEYLNGNNIKKKVEKRNKGTMKKPHMVNKGITCRVQPSHKGTQTGNLNLLSKKFRETMLTLKLHSF